MADNNKKEQSKYSKNIWDLEFARIHRSHEHELLLNDVFEDDDLPVWD